MKLLFVLVAGMLLAVMAFGLWRFSRNRQKLWKSLARATALVLACVSAWLVVLVLLVGAMCGRYDFPPVSSADGFVLARVSERDCGATDSFHSSVQVWRRRQSILANLFGRKGHSTTVFTVGHDPRLVGLEWKESTLLVIRYPNDSRYSEEFRCESRWNDVSIECVAYTPDYSKPVGKMPPVKRCFWGRDW
jgi:hypothetical protein